MSDRTSMATAQSRTETSSTSPASGRLREIRMYEFSVLSANLPLASGYLQAYAMKDEQLRSSYEFNKISTAVYEVDIDSIIDRPQADLYTFSCYVWNQGMVMEIVDRLHGRFDDPHIVLGGPQVMQQGRRYLRPEWPNLVICNGEGERPFAAYLRQLLQDTPALPEVPGISFLDSGEVVTTEPMPRLQEIDEIPSPFLEGLFEVDEYMVASLETNRGCPYKCSYCFWGAATNSRVHFFDQERVLEEIEWISRSGILYIQIVDANFGFAPRDVLFAERIASCHRQYGAPMSVFFASAKNKPKRAIEIAELLGEAGLISTMPVSFQTLDETTLESVARDNIRSSTYREIQRQANEMGTSSFIELIWPLPGETLESFCAGVESLCRLEAQAFKCYPLLLMNNVPMQADRKKFNLLVVPDSDPYSEAEIVVGTSTVSTDEYQRGVRIICHLTALWSCHSLRHVMRALDRRGIGPAEVLKRFDDFVESVEPGPYQQLVTTMVDEGREYKYEAQGSVASLVCNEHRVEFTRLLQAFAASLGVSSDDELATLFDLDLLSRPTMYRNLELPVVEDELQVLVVTDRSAEGTTVVVDIPDQARSYAAECLGSDTVESIRIDYLRDQMPLMKGKQMAENHVYCNDRLSMVGSVLPIIAEDLITAG